MLAKAFEMMKRWETWTALVAVVLASAASFPVPGRLMFAAIAVMLLVVVGVSRLRSARANPKRSASFDSVSQAERIREARRSRYR